MPTSPKPRVAIVGYGLIGRMCALELCHSMDVTVFDPYFDAPEQSAGYIAAAMLAPRSESADCDGAWLKQSSDATTLWQDFLKRHDLPDVLSQTGTLVVSHHADLGAFQQFMQRQKAVAGCILTQLSAYQINALEPDLAPFQHGAFIEGEGHLDNQTLFHAMHARVAKSSTAFFAERAEVLVNQVKTANHTHEFDYVVDCRGAHASKGKLLHSPQQKMPLIRGVRGEVIRVYAPEVTLARAVRLMHPRYALYVVPKGQGEFVVGATQIESEDISDMSVRSALELLSALYSLNPAFSEARILAMQAGLRPATYDNQAVITLDDNHAFINGLYRHGYLLAPRLVNQCVRHIAERFALNELHQTAFSLCEE